MDRFVSILQAGPATEPDLQKDHYGYVAPIVYQGCSPHFANLVPNLKNTGRISRIVRKLQWLNEIWNVIGRASTVVIFGEEWPLQACRGRFYKDCIPLLQSHFRDRFLG